MKQIRAYSILCAIFILLLTGCGNSQPDSAGDRPFSTNTEVLPPVEPIVVPGVESIGQDGPAILLNHEQPTLMESDSLAASVARNIQPFDPQALEGFGGYPGTSQEPTKLRSSVIRFYHGHEAADYNNALNHLKKVFDERLEKINANQ
ncbi:MAG: hypothetical protein AAF570_21280 [Bacteroidota bacterium]